MRTGLLLACATSAVAVACASRGVEPAAAPQSSRWVDVLGRACVAIASCAHSHDSPRESDPGSCVDDWLGRGPNEASVLAACILTARGCDGVDACVRARGDAEAVAFCSANHGLRTACAGTRLVTCSEDDPEESTSVDCAAILATCGESRLPGGLSRHACLAPSVCHEGVMESRCDGPGTLVSCHEGAIERVDCGQGSSCSERLTGEGVREAVCEGTGHRRCDTVNARWCDGTTLVHCQPQGTLGKEVPTDCAAFGLLCDDHASSGPSCVLPGSPACGSRGPRCEGDVLTFCAAGERLGVNCRDVGFGGCDPDAHGVEPACARPAVSSAPPAGRSW